MTAVNQTTELWTVALMGVTAGYADADDGGGLLPRCCWFICNICCWVVC